MTTATLPTPAPPRATVDDLMKVDGKAELIGGRIVPVMPSGEEHGLIGIDIARKLAGFLDDVPIGRAYPDNVTFRVPELTSGRESFSPDVAFIGVLRKRGNTRHIDAAPDFAVEIRSDGDYGRAAEREMAAKRADYFEAGTKVVWDVDPASRTVAKYTAGVMKPTAFNIGDFADAEPGVPGWKLDVAWLFRDE